MVRKIILSSGPEARKKLLRGALIVREAIAMSLGPAGRNAIIRKNYQPPSSTNDGVTIGRHIVLPDEVEDLGAQTIVEASMKTNQRVGDGTTTTAELAGAIIEDCAKKIEEEDQITRSTGYGGADVVGMAREIIEAKNLVIEKLKERAKPVKKGDIKKIISTSLGKMYPEYIESVTEVIEKVGIDGYVSVEDNWYTKYGVETQIVEGMRFLGSYLNAFMVNKTKNREAVMEEVRVLITNERIESLMPLQPLLKEMNQKGVKKLVIIAEGYSGPINKTFAQIVIASRQGNSEALDVLAIKAPSLTTDQFKDVVAFTGGVFYDKNAKDNTLVSASVDNLGYVRKIVVDEDDTIMEGGKGDVKKRIEELKIELESEKDVSFKEQTKRRIGALTSGFAIIRVGAATVPERDYVKMKIEDAVNAAKAALEEGIVQGGGLALKKIAEELGKKNILYKALHAPNERIISNAGGKLEIPADIIDPVKVTRLAVENACSVAAQLITTEVAITEKNRSFVDEVAEQLKPVSDDDDYRSQENEEVGYKT